MNPLDADGICSTCNTSAGNAYVSCFLCHNKFHAFGCTSPANSNICNTSFLQLFRPMSEQSGVNANRPGNFLFFCDKCMTTFETNQTMKMEDKFIALENQMKSLSDDIKAMKTCAETDNNNAMLKNSPSFASVLSNGSNPLNNSAQVRAGITTSNCNQDTSSVPNSDLNVSTKHTTSSITNSVLVIDEFDDDVSEKENVETVEQVVLSNKIMIKDCYKNKSGKTVIVCNSDEQRSLLKSHISESLPKLSVKSPLISNKTITVAGFNPKYNNHIVQTIIDQNVHVSSFLALNSSSNSATDYENHIKVLFVKPLKNNALLSQVVLKVSSGVRDLIKYHGDKLLVGMKGCSVYDRFFVKRCFGCQKYGHIQAKCPTPSVKVCATCSGEHSTKNCNNSENPACANCKHVNFLEHRHHASSTTCPIFQKELEKVKHQSL